METGRTLRDFVLGLIFFGSIALLLYITITLTGFSFHQKNELTVWFANASGLKEGDAVLVSGNPTGKVGRVRYVPDRPQDRRIRVDLILDLPIRLHEGYRVEIREYTLLGGRIVEVEPGPDSAPPLETGAEILGTVAPSALEALAELVNTNRDDFTALVRNLRSASDDLAAGRGLLGALIHDQGMRDDAATFLADARKLGEDIRAGRGTLGALAVDEEVRDRVVSLINDSAAAAEQMRQIAEDIARGDGTLGALLTDESMREDAMQLVANLRDSAEGLERMIRNANEGKGLVGRLLTDEDLADNARQFLDDVASVAARLRRGEGSLGRLLAEDEAYEQLIQALRSLNAQLEDAREAQPVSSFASLLFGNF